MSVYMGTECFGQIVENEAYNNKQANIMLLHTTLTPGMGLKCHFFPEIGTVAYHRFLLLQNWFIKVTQVSDLWASS